MALGIYAGTSATGMTLLPSPTDLKPSKELIWSENTGRAQSGSNKAKMIGDVVAEKTTYNIEWGVLTQSQLNTITSHLTAGFFILASAQQQHRRRIMRKSFTGATSSTNFCR